VNDTVVVRPAVESDLAEVAQLAGQLVRLHHDADPRRFLLVDRVEEGYARWFAQELTRPQAVILVAASPKEVVGYAYGALAGRDWNMLLDAHGAIHDVFVASTARRAGIGRALVSALAATLEKLGAPRLVLSTMVSNEAAQRVFRECGFRATMLEMTRDRPEQPRQV